MSQHKIWDPRWECADRETIRREQFARLQETVAYVYRHVPYYRAKFDAAGVLAVGHSLPGGYPPAALHHQAGFSRYLSVRPVRRAAAGVEPHSLLQRHHGQADGGGLYEE